MSEKEKALMKNMIDKKDLSEQEIALMVAIITLMSTNMGGDFQKKFTPYEASFMLLATEKFIADDVEDILKDALSYALKGVDAEMKGLMKIVKNSKKEDEKSS